MLKSNGSPSTNDSIPTYNTNAQIPIHAVGSTAMPQSHLNHQSMPYLTYPTISADCNALDQHLQPNILVQIPIHTNGQPSHHGHQQPRPQFNRMARGSATGNEIKSEPIKFENEPLSSRASPIAAANANITSTTIGNNSVLPDAPNLNRPLLHNTSLLVTARPKNVPIKCLRCTSCPFISISQAALDDHQAATHHPQSTGTPKRKKIACPGCDNVFYSRNSLQTHLSNDHEMTATDIRVLLQSVLDGSPDDESGGLGAAPSTPVPGASCSYSSKQKIYLKNVEVLINPAHSFLGEPTAIESPTTQSSDAANTTLNMLYDHFSDEFDQQQDLAIPIEDYQDPNDFIDLIDDEFDECTENIHPTIDCFHNKIYVKNDHALKNPDQYHEAHKLEFANTAGGLQFELAQTSGGVQQHPEPSNDPHFFFQPQSDHNNGQLPDDTPHKRSKIFIKNVDILKKPMFVQSSGSNSMSPQPTFVQAFSVAPFFNHTPFTFNPTTTQFLNATSPLPPTNQHKKIFIKNIDILKEPTAMYSGAAPPAAKLAADVRRNTLHLRTVDELNLMNINEVQNLIENFQEDASAPADKHHQTSFAANNEYMYLPDHTSSCLDSVLQDLDAVNYEPMDKLNYPIQTIRNSHDDPPGMPFAGNYHQYPVDHQSTATTSKLEPNVWPDWTDEQRAQPDNDYETNLPTTTPSLFEYEKDFDEDILFVCAQEIINSGDAIGEPPTFAEVHHMPADDVAELSYANCPPSTASTPVNHQLQPPSGDASPRSEAPLDVGGVEQTQTKGRIYVVGNLMKSTSDGEPQTVRVGGGASSPVDVEVRDAIGSGQNGEDFMEDAVERRPKANNTPSKIRTKKAAKEPSTTPPSPKHRCPLNCAISFKCADLLLYHQRCHGATKHDITCPDCPATSDNFSSWNTLHTHLWRVHSRDMELYSCALCNFKTPIRARLLNTHQRIHSSERNFKCARCDKAFKNAKQLKNHLRVHAESTAATGVHQCAHCDQIFNKHRHLRNHERSVHEVAAATLKCDICATVCSSLRARRTHMANHEASAAKRHRCDDCAYASNDANALRRHRKTHDAELLPYRCPHCSYACIQSTTYARHVLKAHPDESKSIVFACAVCKFVSVNQRKYNLHVLNHESGNIRLAKTTTPKKTTTTNDGVGNALTSDVNRQTRPVDEHTAAAGDGDRVKWDTEEEEYGSDVVETATPQRIKVRSGLEMSEENAHFQETAENSFKCANDPG